MDFLLRSYRYGAFIENIRMSLHGHADHRLALSVGRDHAVFHACDLILSGGPLERQYHIRRHFLYRTQLGKISNAQRQFMPIELNALRDGFDCRVTNFQVVERERTHISCHAWIGPEVAQLEFYQTRSVLQCMYQCAVDIHLAIVSGIIPFQFMPSLAA